MSTVEWSVADKMAKPTSALEGYMWDKETEVDRFRERVPLQNLVSQCKLYNLDPAKPKPRDFLGPLRDMANGGDSFVILPECKRMEPSSGSLRKRYNVEKIVKDLTLAGARAISVNCDPVLFGGSLDDIAGICSEDGRVLGMMPHPERATRLELGCGTDGLAILESFLATFM